MQRHFLVISIFCLLSGCGLNMPDFSFLKFWGDDEKPAVKAAVVDPSQLLPDFTEARIEPVAEGIILRVTGVAPFQGYHSARLVQVSATGSVRSFQLRAVAPETIARQGAIRTRQLLVARLLTITELQGVRTIEVISVNRRVQLRNR